MTDSTLAPRLARVYICGPFRSRQNPQDQWIQHKQIEAANVLNHAVWEMGAAALCPHKATENLQGSIPDALFLAGDLAWLEVADAVLVTEDWHRSLGAREEVRLALSWGIPVFNYPGTLAAWLNRQTLTFSRPMPPPNVPDIAEVAALAVFSGRLGLCVDGVPV